MKKLLKPSFLLLYALLPLIFSICPDYPTIPTSQPLHFNSGSPGMLNFPASTKKISITAMINVFTGCSSSNTYNLFSMTATPFGTSSPQSFSIWITCGGEYVGITSDWTSSFNTANIYGPDIGALFINFDFDAKTFQIIMQSNTNRRVSQGTLSVGPTVIFDANSQFHFCRKYDGSDSTTCTLSELTFEYQSYRDSSAYAHFAGLNPTISAFYPLIDGSLATSFGSANPLYFGDSASSPTAGTSPTWDSSNSFVKISAGQFLTVPLPSLSSPFSTVSRSFAFAAWVKITDIPDSTATIFSIYSSTGTQVGYNMVVSQSSNQLSLKFGSLTLGLLSAAPTITLNTWQLIGFTAYLIGDLKKTTGTIFAGTSSSLFNTENQYMDLSAASVIRVGDTSNSFTGHVSTVRMMTPGGGIVRTTDLCSSDNSMELGAGSLSLACSGTKYLNSADNECVDTCPDGTFSPSEAGVPLCYVCPTHCTTCSETQCLTCETNYLLYKGDCIDTCPSKTYTTISACIDCSAHCGVCDNTGCITCDTNYLLYQGGCVDSCPAKTYSDLTSCITCSQDHCAQCDASGCKVCDDGYQFNANKECIPIVTTEKAGGVSGGAVAAIACGCVIIISSAAWIASRFVGKKFPFQPKKTISKTSTHQKIVSSSDLTNLVSPSPNELNTLVP